MTPWTAASHTVSQSLLRLISIESVMPFNYLILCHPLLLLASIFPRIRVFSNESTLLIRRPKCWSFSFSISPSNEYSGLISFRIDRFDLLAVQGTLKSSPGHYIMIKVSIQEKDITIINIYAPQNWSTSTYKANTNKHKRRN